MPPGSLARARIVAAVALFAIAAMSYLRFGPHTMDDAFITYRYARNFAEGHGLVYNAGECVLGYSTPGYALILAAIACTGFPLPTAGLILSGLGGVLSLALLILYAKELGCEIAGWCAAFFLSVQMVWVVMVSCGMETTLFTAALLAMLLQLARGQDRWIGPLMAAVVLFRYDGVLAAAVAGCLLWRAAGWRVAFREGAIAACIYAPWIIFSTWYYGSPIPQTIVAKDFLYHLSWQEAAYHFNDYLRLFQTEGELWCVAAGLGIYACCKMGARRAAGPTWAAIFVSFYFVKRVPILYFIWYLAPALVVLTLSSCVAVQLKLERCKLRSDRRVIAGVAIIVGTLFAVQARGMHRAESYYGINVKSRESYYQDTANELQKTIRHGDSVLTGEVGALGWYLPDAYIIDGSGLVSREPLTIRRRELETGAEFDHAIGGVQTTISMLQELKPTYFTARKLFTPYHELVKDPWFQTNYTPLHGEAFDAYEQFVFLRTPPGKGDPAP